MTATHLASAGLIVTSSATVAVVQGVNIFTAFAVMGAAAGVFYSFLSHNEQRQPPREVKARVILGMIGGAIIPRVFDYLMQYYFPKIAEYFTDPLIVIGMGFVSAWVCYVILHRIFQQGDNQSDQIARSAVRAAQAVVGMKQEEKNQASHEQSKS